MIPPRARFRALGPNDAPLFFRMVGIVQEERRSSETRWASQDEDEPHPRHRDRDRLLGKTQWKLAHRIRTSVIDGTGSLDSGSDSKEAS